LSVSEKHIAVYTVVFYLGLDSVMRKIPRIPLDDNMYIQARRPKLSANSVSIENTTTQRCTEDSLERCAANSDKSEIDDCKKTGVVDKESMEVPSYSSLGENVDYVTQDKISLSQSMLSSSSQIEQKQEFFSMKVSKPLMGCVKKNKENLQKMLTPLCAVISINTESKISEQIEINSCPGSESVEDWKTSCQLLVDSYLKDLVSETIDFSSEHKTAVHSLISSYVESHPLVDIKFNEENLKVVISGEKSAVEKLKFQICEMQKANAGSRGSRFLKYAKAKLWNRNRKKTKDEEDFEIIDDFVMSCTTVNTSKGIARFLSTIRGKNLLQSYLQSFESLFTVEFDHSGQLILLCTSKEDGISAAKKIKEHVKYVSVPFELPEVLFKGKEWISLQTNLEETYSASIILSKDQLLIFGDKRSLLAVKESIQKFLEGNCYIEKSIPLCWAQWRLLTTYMIDKWVKVKQKIDDESMIKHEIPNNEHKEPSILLKGGKPVVTYFAKEVENLVFSICTSPPIEQARPGTVKFFQSEKGTTLLRGIEAEEKSCIQLNVLQDDVENDGSKDCCTKLCTGKTKDGTTITLVQGDITEFPVDVIVNAANRDLKHVGGVALAIAKKGGPIIQEDSDLYISREGKLSDGDAVMAKKVGKLPCKLLIHAVGPKWDDGLNYEEVILNKVCLESLKLASNFRTVSFPAISSGVFGFPVKKCAECMMKAFLEYCTSSALSPLREIIIVVHDQSAVSAFTQEMYRNLESARRFSASAPFDTLAEVKSDSTAHPEHSTQPVSNAYPQQTTQSVSTAEHTTCPVSTAHPQNTTHTVSTAHFDHTAYPECNTHPDCSTTKKKITSSSHDIITQFIQLHKGELLKQKVCTGSSSI